MSQIVVNRADVDELDELMAWRMEVLREVFFDSSANAVEQLEKANRQYYSSALRDGTHIACFARKDDEIVGCGGVCLHTEMPSPDNASGRCAYLMNIYTRPRNRGRGVGGAVVDWLVGEARSRGAEKIYLEATAAGRPLYESAGFTDMRGYMQLRK